MRHLDKLEIPESLAINAEDWLADYVADKTDSTKKYRYREKTIKSKLVAETSNKCVYCESKIGHNTPGDVEHKIPTSACEELHFTWENLTIACTECNRRKNAYYDEELPFVDPYVDDVETMFIHLGPVVAWVPGDKRAEISARTLGLHGKARIPLVLKKIEKIEETQNLIERYQSETNAVLKGLLRKALLDLADKSSEFSAMVFTHLNNAGI
jgi:hypothetical protein